MSIQSKAAVRQKLQSLPDELPETPDSLEQLSGWNTPEAAGYAERHSILVDKKFREGLSPDEEKELEQIRIIFDQYDAPFYEPIIKRLTALAAQFSKENSQSQPESR